jgi:hypothetical protein
LEIISKNKISANIGISHYTDDQIKRLKLEINNKQEHMVLATTDK